MKKLTKYYFIFFVLFFSTSIDNPTINNEIVISEIKGTPKLVEEIKKLDKLEARIDKLISGKLDK